MDVQSVTLARYRPGVAAEAGTVPCGAPPRPRDFKCVERAVRRVAVSRADRDGDTRAGTVPVATSERGGVCPVSAYQQARRDTERARTALDAGIGMSVSTRVTSASRRDACDALGWHHAHHSIDRGRAARDSS